MPLKKGFTLIELLVAIIVIGILVAMAMVVLTNAKERMRDAARKEDIKEIAGALEIYFADKKTGSYKTTSGPVTVDENSTGLTSQYLKEIPVEPYDQSYPYKYLTNAAGKDFAVFCRLESSFDGEIKKSDPVAGGMPQGYNFWIENRK